MTLLELFGNVVRFTGLLATFVGLWFSAGGMRVVVSGRVDERRRSANSFKRGVPLLCLGILLLVGGTWLTRWAQM